MTLTILKTHRTILSTMIALDEKDVQLLYQNKDVRKYLGGVIDDAVFADKFRACLVSERQSYYFVIKDRETTAFIGLISVTPYHESLSHEVSYQLQPSYWNQGYGAEVMTKILDHASSSLLLKQLCAETQKANIASIRLLEKVGMKFERELERFGAVQVIYSINLSSDEL